jgi:hypothetical protein
MSETKPVKLSFAKLKSVKPKVKGKSAKENTTNTIEASGIAKVDNSPSIKKNENEEHKMSVKNDEDTENDTEEKLDESERINTNNQTDTTFILTNLNFPQLDRLHTLGEIAKKQERNSMAGSTALAILSSNDETTKYLGLIDSELKNSSLIPVKAVRTSKKTNSTNNESIETNENDQFLSTSLTKLGISSVRKDPTETIVWGDYYKIKIYVNTLNDINGTLRQTELTSNYRVKCSWCHLFPLPGTLMIGVPYKYVSNYIEEHVYAPECVNVVKQIVVEPTKEEKENKKKDKITLKSNYFKRDLTSRDMIKRNRDCSNIKHNDYFETIKPACSFNCALSKGKELAFSDGRFRNIEMLLTFMYYKIFDKLPKTKILPAGPCELLQENGGPFTEDEYRKMFQTSFIQSTNQVCEKVKSAVHPMAELFYEI